MEKKEMIALMQKYQAKADEAYQNYQQTGAPRYDKARQRAEDIADALRLAAFAAEDHDKLLRLQADLHVLASRADRIAGGQQDMAGVLYEALAQDVIAVGCAHGLYKQTAKPAVQQIKRGPDDA